MFGNTRFTPNSLLNRSQQGITTASQSIRKLLQPVLKLVLWLPITRNFLVNAITRTFPVTALTSRPCYALTGAQESPTSYPTKISLLFAQQGNSLLTLLRSLVKGLPCYSFADMRIWNMSRGFPRLPEASQGFPRHPSASPHGPGRPQGGP